MTRFKYTFALTVIISYAVKSRVSLTWPHGSKSSNVVTGKHCGPALSSSQ
jgi:hypothetical protein